MTQPPYLVVGAGPSGLAIASELAQTCDVTLIDRIPVTGGMVGWSNPAVGRMTDMAIGRGVQLRLGQTAVRYDSSSLLLATAGGFERVEGRHLFFTGGLRPATLADLGIFGDRPAGVVPATVAEHLLQAGVRLWRRVVLVGDGPWAVSVAEMCQRLGTHVTAVSSHATWGHVRVEPAPRMSVVGRQRVTALRLHLDTGDSDLACDAIVLAADPRPNRSIEGALNEGDVGVTFHQPVLPADPEGRFAAARVAVRGWLTSTGGAP